MVTRFVPRSLGLDEDTAKRRKTVVQREDRFKPQRANEVWNPDFVSDELGIR